MKTLRVYGDGYGCRVALQYDDLGTSGYFYIVDETPGKPRQTITFMPQELADLVEVIGGVIEQNRSRGVYPYTGKTVVIDGMTLHVREESAR